MSDSIEKQIKVMPLEAIVDIKISGVFYSRLRATMLYFANKFGDDLAKVLQELHDREPETPDEYNLITLLTITQAVEAEAAKQGHSIDKTLTFDKEGNLTNSGLQVDDPGN